MTHVTLTQGGARNKTVITVMAACACPHTAGAVALFMVSPLIHHLFSAVVETEGLKAFLQRSRVTVPSASPSNPMPSLSLGLSLLVSAQCPQRPLRLFTQTPDTGDIWAKSSPRLCHQLHPTTSVCLLSKSHPLGTCDSSLSSCDNETCAYQNTKKPCALPRPSKIVACC